MLCIGESVNEKVCVCVGLHGCGQMLTSVGHSLNELLFAPLHHVLEDVMLTGLWIIHTHLIKVWLLGSSVLIRVRRSISRPGQQVALVTYTIHHPLDRVPACSLPRFMNYGGRTEKGDNKTFTFFPLLF